MANKRTVTRFGWPLRITPTTKFRSLLNHPIQAAGADIPRLAIIGLVANGIRVCAPIHDAVLTECRIGEVEEHTAEVQRIMRKAAKVGLGQEIPVDCKVTVAPERYTDDRGTEMFNRVMKLLREEISHTFTQSHVHAVPRGIYIKNKKDKKGWETLRTRTRVRVPLAYELHRAQAGTAHE